MRTSRKFVYLSGIATAVILMTAAPVLAQDATATQPRDDAAQADQVTPPTDRAADSDDIIVTAQRRAERLQDVPIAISAVGGEQLERLNTQTLGDLRGSVPGLTISNAAGVNGSNVVSIRGIQAVPLPIGNSSATGIYLDGVYLSRPDAAFFGLDDIERVEVLRGPQGTLYGRNTTGGAINIITRTPGDTVEGGFDVNYGNYEAITAKASLSAPIAGGFGVAVSGSYLDRDGYFFNTATNTRVGDRNSWTVRGKLHYASPGDAFTATLSGDAAATHGLTIVKNLFVNAQVPPAFNTSGTYTNLTGPNPDEVSLDAATLARTGYFSRSRGGALTLNYDVSPSLSFTSITGFRRIDVTEGYDLDFTALVNSYITSENTSKTWTQELRANVNVGPIKATLGGNYFNDKATYLQRGIFAIGGNYATSIVLPPASFSDETELDAWAVFGQAELALGNRLSLVGGLRYNSEDRDCTVITSAGVRLPCPPIKDKVLLPSAGVNFKASPDVLVYAKASKGYQAPGFNPSPVAGGVDTFNEEDLWAYEVGLKSQFLDRRVTLNTAAFYYDYSRLQVRTTVSAGVSRIDDAGGARVKGVEASLEVRPVAGLTLTAQATYLDAKYTNFCQGTNGDGTGADPALNDPPCVAAGVVNGASRNGNRLNLAPEWSGGFGVNYALPVANAGTLRFSAQYTFESNTFNNTNNDPLAGSGGWHRLDGTIGFEIEGGAEVYVFSRNLTNDRWGSNTRSQRFLIVNTPNDPRTYGAGLRMHF